MSTAHRDTVNRGFTIVELLIVIVVISILVAISLVAYRGIQNRAYDVTVQSDTRNFSTKIGLFRFDNGRYPDPGEKPVFAELVSLGYSASRGAYKIAPDVQRNIVYCTSIDRKSYALLVKSRSGNAYYASSHNGSTIKPYTDTWTSSTYSADLCSSPMIKLEKSEVNQTSGYIPNYDGWQGWTGLGD